MSDDGRQLRAEILSHIGWATEKNGWPPTVREISEHFNRAPSTVHHHLFLLTQDGLLENGGGPRKLRVTPDGWDWLGYRVELAS